MGLTGFLQPMKSCSANPVIERAQPWLGTIVRIRVEGLPSGQAHNAIDAAFAEVATVQRLMSFHEPGSDISRLNRDGSSRRVDVHPYTLDVLREALAISASTNGCFDISVGAELVAWDMLPHPAGESPVPDGCWRNIEICSDSHVRFHRPVWIDVGGIAKGYAVDKAIGCLRESGARRAVVNAGGDIRVLGEETEQIRLAPDFPVDSVPILQLADGSVASSSRQSRQDPVRGPHIHGITRSPAPPDRFVSVVAERCIIADALTKVVMAEGESAFETLEQFEACAHFHDPLTGWRHLGGGAESQ